ncbi:class I SAM-dependent methyltransferase [Azospirillum sp. TSA6c]|uniref:class I SAM-dependent DNA methyltransferase n=1 Tax=unclassified Azospirillum TaxID=2630922 RepID=UPI000D6526C2|nr:class I SAM-dependent methyltransferase [Azospirillum sp. TSA6c]
MSNGVFGAGYAAAYDALYRDKDYENECDLIESILKENGFCGPIHLLDLGCGTGNHVFPLALRGHTLTGVDRSHDMLALAYEKAEKIKETGDTISPTFHHGDVRNLNLNERFDAVLMMFAVLGYQHENTDLMATLSTVRSHLKPGGLFIFDVWNGLAVLTDKPGQRVRTVHQNGTRIIRTTETRVDTQHHRCHVHFGVLCIQNGHIIDEQDEEHVMRFFFPQEIDLALGYAGLKLIKLSGFPDYKEPADENSWNIIGVAKAI